MTTTRRAVIAFGIVALMLGWPARTWADETDNFTCRDRPLADALGAIDGWVNARIREAVERANRRGHGACDAACLFGELRDRVGGSERRPWTWIAHARLARWIEGRQDIERCRLEFKASIYGARRYNQPWLLPFTGRIIFLADSVRLAGAVVGIDKVNHFIREGLAHWRAIEEEGGTIAAVLAHELGPPRRQLGMTEHGLKGMSLTGVVSYADLAASYSGFRFWSEVLSLGRLESFVAADPASGFAQRRQFTFADYVNDAWDEGINCSTFHPSLAQDVRAALRRRSVTCPVTDCGQLAELPEARLYLNPACLPPGAVTGTTPGYRKLSIGTGVSVSAGVKPNTLP